MYWMNFVGAVGYTVAMLLIRRKGRPALAGAFGLLAAYTVFSRIFSAVMPEWLVLALPVSGIVLICIDYGSRRRNAASAS
jgi:hypothetical protein